MTGPGRTAGASLAALLAGGLLATASAGAHLPPAPEKVDPLPIRQALEPPLLPTPQADCGPGSRPETGIQGRVPRSDHESGRATEGYTCNAEQVGHYGKETPLGTIGGFKVERYVDAAGHDCAYYDTTLMYPTNLLDEEGGVNVLDMSDPSGPKLTDRLVTPAMLDTLKGQGIADKELSTLLATDRVIPVAHGTTFEALRKVSPMLASRSGLGTAESSLADVAAKIAAAAAALADTGV